MKQDYFHMTKISAIKKEKLHPPPPKKSNNISAKTLQRAENMTNF